MHLEDINPLLAGQILDYLMRLGIEFLDEPASVDEIDPAGGIVLWAPHDRKPSSVLSHLVDGDRVREVGTRTDPHGGLYLATQSGFYSGAGV